MDNLWRDEEAKAFEHSDLAMRVYTSRLLGRSDDLVLHGGGNTSVKSPRANIFGEEEDILFVKGSGWDLKTIEEPGFSPARLAVLKRLAGLPTMTDTEMTRELKASMTDPSAPSPSVEAILHALIPFKYVDHTHTDAVVAISNSPDGETRLEEIYGGSVLILPYIMPGFVLAKQVFDKTRGLDWNSLEGIVLLHHGLFTFHDSAKDSYDKMIELVTRAEDYLRSINAFDHLEEADYQPQPEDYLRLAQSRRAASQHFGAPMLTTWKLDKSSVGFSSINSIDSIATRGPVTPDHTLQTKRIAAILDDSPVDGINQFATEYLDYFKRNNNGELKCLDPAPRYAVWKGRGMLVFGANIKRAGVISDIVDHTAKAVQWGEAMGGWKTLTEAEIFELEYWELEQAKLKLAAASAEFDGKVIVVTGAASGIGKACVETFASKGAAVIALDINPDIATLFDKPGIEGIVCDITSDESIQSAVEQGVTAFGGIDVLVSNAGSFPPSTNIEDMAGDLLEKTMQLNFLGHVAMIRTCTPFLKLGFDPSVILMSSKNVPAPGPGAGAYSAAKSALTQVGRVAAMELGGYGIRVNMLHPNAVFDTGIWTEEVLRKRAESYGLSIEEYKTNNILKVEITSHDVAALVLTLCAQSFSKTTGAQVPIDGGNDRVI
ncbi:MAG TPA: bifunctional aldolase/short-chain dehydrogenase [Gammaproteobacteria bacterium]|jgi:rhamnose utilization protein RhaD (predicted bifunctional aldolase and dehydrogenase)/NAD(P)-dependent dehydrogenase (short-subunit alcohol dehydrogenase family)|nr:bifunctional aldolase/short-chain dehydrogenase [Gammaproteobacteria bacterium]HAJ75526.1 bifunctional aldolase/short-chain dehydrogenase [Gammaproteobacteria bacterium]|tara:strand:+ start:2298 stop:4277 length:1980 start_codon:yes stop_codon:yes gene_type:complete